VEACEALEPFHHLQADVPPRPQRPHPGDEITDVGLIRPDQSKPGKPVPEDFQELLRAIAVLHVSSGDHDTQKQALVLRFIKNSRVG
jgi:hypothetical protein